jgi:hypothetical protein
MEKAKRRTRRRHDAELKRRVLEECAAPGASVANVAMAHGLNANLVHKWRRQAHPSVLPSTQAFVPVAGVPCFRGKLHVTDLLRRCCWFEETASGKVREACTQTS